MKKKRFWALVLSLMMLCPLVPEAGLAESGPKLIPREGIKGVHLRGETIDAKFSYTPAYIYETLCMQVTNENNKVVGSSYRNVKNESASTKTWTVHITTEKFNAGDYKVSSWVRVFTDGKYLTFSHRSTPFFLYGWKQVGKEWTWLREDKTSPQSEWMTIEGKTYYFTVKGFRKTGWLKQDGKTYWFDDEGVMAIHWKTIDGEKYFFDKEGVMSVGWKKISGKWYYFDEGKMVTGKRVIDGIEQKFDKDGVWQGKGDPPDPDQLPKKVTLSEEKATLEIGETLTLKAEVSPEKADDSVTWTSSDEKVATVSKKGVVTAVGAGKAVITCRTINGLEAKCSVKVKAPEPTGVKLSKSGTVKMKVGETLTLKATLKPEGAVSELTWKSSDKKVAKVSSKGVVTAVGKGTCVITVTTANGKTAEVKIKVK